MDLIAIIFIGIILYAALDKFGVIDRFKS